MQIKFPVWSNPGRATLEKLKGRTRGFIQKFNFLILAWTLRLDTGTQPKKRDCILTQSSRMFTLSVGSHFHFSLSLAKKPLTRGKPCGIAFNWN